MFDVWVALQNAWQIVAGMNGIAYIGFDRPAAESVMRMSGVKKRDRGKLLEDLSTVESAALPILNSK